MAAFFALALLVGSVTDACACLAADIAFEDAFVAAVCVALAAFFILAHIGLVSLYSTL